MIKKVRYSIQGQMTIFFALVMVLLLTVMAFLINVGLFVKAKINLQNAVDAAAYAGAAVQARQLTDIAYLNWELRNVYKEFMFKYYVLGQLSNPNTGINKIGSSTVNFALDSLPGSNITDQFNVPSVCIQFSNPCPAGTPAGQCPNSNICSIYTIPGVPRFGPVGLPGVDETNNEFINQIVRQKSQDCAERSSLNFKTTANWAYGVKTNDAPDSFSDIFGDAPSIALNRMGAWPAAIELAIRIRNLEKVVNQPPTSVCRSAGIEGCQLGIDNFVQEGNAFPLNERTFKAFWSGFKNLSNSEQTNILGIGDSDFNMLKQSFVLTELSPGVQSVDKGSGRLLIPKEINSVEKYYLDLRLSLINMAIFFNSFVTQSGTDAGTQSHAQCAVTKTALPVPGYPLGFDKNPAVMTYYAVKGTAKYRGLLNPFTQLSGGADMEAYAVAKPFGGRIGPILFKHEDRFVTARADQQNRSAPYISGVAPVANPNSLPIPLMPLDPDFWVQNDNDNIGGEPQAGFSAKFVIPNLVYDIGSAESLENMAAGGSGDTNKINKISRGGIQTPIGLYDPDQYKAFREILERAKTTTNGIVDNNTIERAIRGVHMPTRYEAMNYLIPNLHSEPLETFSSTTRKQGDGSIENPIYYPIPAPLYGPGLWYEDINAIENAVNDYLQDNEGAVNVYLEALKSISESIQADSNSQRGTSNNSLAREDLYSSASQLFSSDANGSLGCTSLAGQFSAFFTGTPANCGIPLLKDNLRESLNNRAQGSDEFSLKYLGEFVFPAENVRDVPDNNVNESERVDLLSAYRPGARSTGSNAEGEIPHPFGISPSVKSRRNYYSTKFISFKHITTTLDQNYSNYGVYNEGILGRYRRDNEDDSSDTTSGIINRVDAQEVQNIYH